MTGLLDRLKPAVADRYSIQQESGRSGMAVVCLARDFPHKRSVALAVLRRERAASSGAERFLREIQVAARPDRPHVLGATPSPTPTGR